LDDFHVLFFLKVKLVEVETYSVESCKDDLAEVELFDVISKNSSDVGFILLALVLFCTRVRYSSVKSL